MKDLEERLARERASKGSLTLEMEAAEAAYDKQLMALKLQLKAASGKLEAQDPGTLETLGIVSISQLVNSIFFSICRFRLRGRYLTLVI